MICWIRSTHELVGKLGLQVCDQQDDRESAVVAVERLGHDDERGEVREENLILRRRGDGVVRGMKVGLVRSRDLHEHVGQ